MKRIIDGKVYDTDTAEAIASHSANRSRSDFDFCEETLYRTSRGSWSSDSRRLREEVDAAFGDSYSGSSGLE